jgi:hypothetical protein
MLGTDMKKIMVISLLLVAGCSSNTRIPEYIEPAGEDVANLVVDFKDHIGTRKFTLDGLLNGTPELYIVAGDMIDQSCSEGKENAIDRAYEEYESDGKKLKKLSFKVPANEEFRFFLPVRSKITNKYTWNKKYVTNTYCFAHVSFLPKKGMNYQADFILDETNCTFDVFQKNTNGEKIHIKYFEHPPCVIKGKGDTSLNSLLQRTYKHMPWSIEKKPKISRK